MVLRPSSTTLRRLSLLENRRSVNKPIGLFPAIVRDYDEWEKLAEANQMELARLTRGEAGIVMAESLDVPVVMRRGLPNRR